MERGTDAAVETHPSKISVRREFEVFDEKGASEAAEQMVRMGFDGSGFRVLFPKADKKTARRIGYTLTTSVNYGLRQAGRRRGIRYWTYHHDASRYAIVMVKAEQ